MQEEYLEIPSISDVEKLEKRLEIVLNDYGLKTQIIAIVNILYNNHEKNFDCYHEFIGFIVDMINCASGHDVESYPEEEDD